MRLYEADIAYEGPWDDDSVRAWTMALIDAETRR
jgi:hypothetical protein